MARSLEQVQRDRIIEKLGDVIQDAISADIQPTDFLSMIRAEWESSLLTKARFDDDVFKKALLTGK